MTEENNSNQKSEAALREEKVLEFWKDNKIFEKSLKEREGQKEFIFYEGPPTANAKPALHHLASRAFKDVIPRYKTMRGYHVRRKAGWDTHGLPVELQVEKKLGLNSKKAIEEYGIAKFNRECRESVWEHVGTWNKFTERSGYWVDRDNPYITYNNDYIESAWNIVQKINERELLFKDYKVVPWCPRCGTALSSHELAQGYEDVKDLSVYAKFKVRPREGVDDHTYILAWTTTPWTLPGNVALAVGEDIDYVKVSAQGGFASGGKSNEVFILAKDRISLLTEPYKVLEEFKGKELIGLDYEPLFPYFSETISDSEKPKLEKSFKVHAADFVTTGDGTGVVHTAVMYGQDDFVLGTRLGLPKHHLVGLDGRFLPGTGIFEGRNVHDEEVAVDIIKDLAHRGLLFKKEKYEHSYPHCWRCKTALIYYARDSWYIRMSDPKIKEEMIRENREINWEPPHIRDGRFGEWLREIKDWAISRERYWGTPLPIWQNSDGTKRLVVDSIETLKKYSKKSGNKYFLMRHGEAIDNARHIFDPKGDPNNHLTDKGKEEIISSIQVLKKKNIDMIISSPFIRTRETAEIVCQELGLPKESVLTDERLHEYNETDVEFVKRRMGAFIFEAEELHKGKNIIIVSHGNPLWVLGKIAGSEKDENFSEEKMFNTAEIHEMPFYPMPHNENFELDLHRPYIDEVVLEKDGEEYRRIKEVMDVWFDSGAMPFAQDHYPFDNKKWVDGKGYPADYICEAIDQTRGWFYTLHAVGILMGRGKAYKNVICLGHLLDASGKKMSKSLGNVVEPFEAMDKYGVDALRLWMYSVNQPGESKNFDEKTVTLLHNQVFGLLYNVLAFYELYRDKNVESNTRPKSENILDIWILAKLDLLIDLMTESMDSYKLLEPTRAMKDFIGDLSTWYLRRSRERIKSASGQAYGVTKDGEEAKKTLYFVLKTVAKLMAPSAPFAADDIWLKLKNDPSTSLRASSDKESVHLEFWPKKPFTFFKFGKSNVISDMEEVRKIVTLGLEARQKAGIKVRQPLAKLKLKVESRKLSSEYMVLIKDELNVKEVIFDNSIDNEIELDINITEELKEEGDYRELVRSLQDMRKSMGLTPSESVKLEFNTHKAGENLVKKFEADLKKTVLVSKIEFTHHKSENIIKVGDLAFKVKMGK